MNKYCSSLLTNSITKPFRQLTFAAIAASALLLALPSQAASGQSHFVGLFAGIHDADESETILGVEYEYKFNANWGAGALYEKAGDAHHGDGIESTIAALYYHPDNHWRFGAGLGQEKIGGDHSHTEDLLRLGVSYDFHFEGFGIAPSVNFDRVDDETATVYGVAVVFSF